MINLNRKVAIVTGSTGGLGLGISLVLANQGAYVAALATSEGKLKDLDLIMRQHGHHETRYFVANVSDDDSTKVAVRAVFEHYGKIDILVNNAGVVAASGWEDRIDSSDADWALNYEVNLRGLARVIDTVVPHMKNQKSGKIVNISSGAARQPGIHLPPAYGATKEGVINLTKYYALALAPFNINVNAICPGLIWTPMWEKVGMHMGASMEGEKKKTPREVFDSQVESRVPLGRPQTPEDIGSAVAFLVSEEAGNITGQTLNVNGGARMD